MANLFELIAQQTKENLAKQKEAVSTLASHFDYSKESMPKITSVQKSETAKNTLNNIGNWLTGILSKSPIVQTIADIQAGMKPLEAFKKVYIEKPEEQVQIATEREAIRQKYLAQGKTPEEALKLSRIAFTPSQVAQTESMAMGFIGGIGEVKGIVPALKIAKTAEEAANVLRKSGVAEDLIQSYAPKFARLIDEKAIQEGLTSLEGAIKTTKPVLPKVGGVSEVPKETILYHGTSKESAARIKAMGGFTPETAKDLKDLTGFDFPVDRPISLTLDKKTAELYSGIRPEGGTGELLAFKGDNLKLATEADIKKLGLNQYGNYDKFISDLKKNGYDGYHTSSPHDEMVETVVFNKEKLKLIPQLLAQEAIPIHLNKPTIDSMAKAYIERNPVIMKRPIALVKENGKISILEGEHRFYAAKKAGVEPPMVLLTRKATDNLNASQIDVLARKVYSGKNTSELTDFYNQVVKGVKPISGEISAKAKSITEGIPEVPPPLSPKVLPISEELSSIDKITQALKESKPLRGQQEKLYTQERGVKMAKALAVGEKTTGEAGFYKELGQLKGELPKVQFESIRNKIGQEDIDSLFNQVKDSRLLNFWDKVSARGGLVKVFEGRVPTEGELTLLNRVFPKEFIDTILSKRDLFSKFKEAGYQLANIPRSVMASFDLSAPFRQGLFLISHPRRFFGSFKDMIKAFGSENAFNAIQETIVRKPTFDLMQEGKLALTEMKSILTQREEKFMSNWAEKIPIVGKIIRASGRAYTGFLNKLRADVFEDLVLKADKLGLTPKSNPNLVKEISNFVNVASGRGSLGNLQPAATFLNSFFFSPRLMASRLTLLNPVYYIKAEPFVRKEALKSLFTVLGVGTSMLGLAKLAGADVGTDPRSADFGKIIIGKTRIDVWGGFQQYIRMFAQLGTGQYVSSVTGKLVTLGEGYKPLTRFEILQRQIEAKEAPVFSLITTLLKGQNFLGEKVKITDEIKNRFTPMAIQDIYDIYKNDPEVLSISGLGMFGFGLQTYSGDIPTEKEKKDTYKISQILGEQAKEREELSNASNLLYQKLKEMPKEQAKIEFNRLIKENPEMANKINDLIQEDKSGLTYTEKMIKQLGVENGQRAKYVVEELNKLSKEEKRSYYQNLIDKKIITKQVNSQILELLK